MNQINTGDFNNEITRDLEEIRRLAAETRGVRVLQELELSVVSGGDGPVGWL
jgi:hypothetical protein